MNPVVTLSTLILAIHVTGAAWAQLPGTEGYRTQSQQREELIAKLRRDIAKVAHSVEVTQELISRSRGAPFLPDIYLRLAELYVEQARYEFYLVHEERGESAKGSAVAPTAKLLKEKAVETYQRILADFPDYESNDQVLFFMAHEYRELGQYEDMISTYERLVSKYPRSPLVLDGYLVLGDYRFDKQDLNGAKGYYQKILDLPKSETHAMAHFKMGWVYLNEFDYKRAFHHFEQAVVVADEGPDEGKRAEVANSVNVKREALTDLAYAYTEVRKPKGSLRYFRRLASSRNMYLLALDKLAKRYFIKQEFDAAAMVYREIVRLSHDAETNLDYTGRIYESANRTTNYLRVDDDVDAMLDAVDDYRFDWRIPKAQRNAAEKDFEVYARDLATKAQERALRRRPEQMGPKVAAAYRRYLASFPDSDQYDEIVQNLADTLYEAKIYIAAGDRFAEAAQLVSDDEKLYEQNLYNACAAFHEALQESSRLPRFDRIWAQQGLIQNGITYVETFPSSRKVPTIKLNIGRSYFEGGDFERAVGVFDEFIENYPTHPAATSVAELILDAYAQQQDFAGMSEAAKRLAQVERLGDDAFRRRLLNTARSAEERQIGEVILTASVDKDAGGDAGDRLRQFWENNRDSPVAEKTLYTAFVQYKEARDFDKTFELGNQFIGAYPNSEYLGDVFGTLASFTSQTGDYEEAAVYLEEFYKRFPTDSSAQRMLAQAATIKQLIGDHRGAIAAYGTLLRSVRSPDQRSEYAAAMLDSYESLADWQGMQRAAQDVLAQDRGNVKAHLMAGLGAMKQGDTNGAITSFQQSVRAAGRSSSPEDQAAAARAAFLLGDIVFQQFRSIDAGGDVQTAVQAKAELLGQLESVMVDAVGFNQGEWAVAALHRVALAYADLADFLAAAPLPPGLSAAEAEQYQSLVAQQTEGIRTKSAEYFDTCVGKARELKVFTAAVLGCVARGPEPRLDVIGSVGGSPAPQRKDELQTQLTQNPKDLQAIGDLADYFLASDQPAKAKLMASRGLDVDEREPRFHNQIGMAELLLGHPQDAYFGFERAAELGHEYAAANLVALMTEFGDREGAARAADDIDTGDLPVGAPDLHPNARAAVDQAQ